MRSLGAAADEADLPSRDRLLEAASDLMIERGGIDISLSEIAARSGLNSSLVKYYFGNKRGLLLALLERNAKSALKALEYLVNSEMSPTEKLRRHLTGVIHAYYRYPYLNRLLHHLMDDPDPSTAEAIGEFFVAPLVRFQTKILEAGVAAGELRPVDPMLFYFSATGACEHLFYALRGWRGVFKTDHVDAALRDAYAEHIAAMILDGVRA